MKKVVIVGGGVSGLICSHIFSRYECQIKVLEPNKIGGEFLSGGLKYIHKTDHMERLFDGLGLMWSTYAVKGGILLRGCVQPYPDYFKELGKDEVSRIQADHYRKTRRVEPSKFAKTAMNDPAGSKPRRALRCYFPEMVEKLAENTNIVNIGVKKIYETFLLLDNSAIERFDYLVLTIPLWAIKRMSDFELPDGVAIKLNVAIVQPKKDEFSKWDYVYTPYTPEDCIHRISPGGENYAVEVNGDLDELKLHSDLNFLFKDGWYVESIKEGLKGHLLPLDSKPKLPDNIALLGRFAKWDPRATADVTLVDSMKLAERWFDG